MVYSLECWQHLHFLVCTHIWKQGFCLIFWDIAHAVTPANPKRFFFVTFRGLLGSGRVLARLLLTDTGIFVMRGLFPIGWELGHRLGGCFSLPKNLLWALGLWRAYSPFYFSKTSTNPDFYNIKALVDFVSSICTEKGAGHDPLKNLAYLWILIIEWS